MPWAGLVERQLPSNSSEQLLDILGRLGRRFEEEQASLAGISLGLCSRHSALVGLLRHQVQLVSGQRDDDVLVSLPLQFLDPRLGLIQG
jgi:hypothetical protein